MKKERATKNRLTSASGRGQRFRHSKFYAIMYEKGVLIFLLSFLIPAAIMTFAFAMQGIHPFGQRQILVVDLWHQYYPFFRVVREKLLTGGSFLYSWQNGMGTNFLSLISYYAASPLNWLSILFSEANVRDALTFILIAKIGFSGAFFSCFLRYTYKRKDLSVCIFSVMYALSSYTLGYYWNVMWFDTIALFPLVMLGIVAICREGKWKTFTFALALSLISNYYIGWFTCLFSVFMFAAWGIIEFKSIKDLLYKLYIIVRSSVIGIALGGFILLPAYYGLQLTHSANNEFPKETTFYEKWTDILGNLISYNAPVKVEGLPNFACGMLAVLLFGVFLFSFGIKIREKVSTLLMLALIVVSCNVNKLNYIWHGFHFTNQIPYRFAFIFCFILAAAAFRAYDIILKKGVKIYQLVFMLAGPACVFAMNYISKGDEFEFRGAIRSSVIITAAFWLIFLAAKVFPFKRPQSRNALMSVALAAAVFSEFIAAARKGVETVSTTSYTDYPTNAAAVGSLLEAADEADDSLFYRTEMTQTYTLNDSALYGYNGISQFSSAANVSVTTFIKRLGLYASEAGNRYYYRTATPVVNSLLGIKYIIKKNGSLSSEIMALEFSGKAQDSYMYENKYPLSLGFMMDEGILDMPDSSGVNPFEYQNTLVRLAAGIDDNCFTAQPVALVEYNNMEVTKNGFGNYTFRNNEKKPDASATYSFSGVEDGYLYGYASSTGGCCDNISIKCNGQLVDSGNLIESYPIVFPMGNGQSGSTSTVQISSKSDSFSGNFKLMIYALSQPVFEKAYSRLADEQLGITHFSDTKIEGKINALDDGVMFLSIPYEKGWKVIVDGEEAETFAVMQSMLGVKLSAGEHTIVLKYTPEGFAAGVVISVSAVVLLITVIWFENKRRKKKKGAAAADSSNEPSLAEVNDAAYEEDFIPAGTGTIYNQECEYPENRTLTDGGTVQENAASDNISAEKTISSADAEGQNEKSQSDDSLQGN